MEKEGMEKFERWKNFEQWKKELIHDFEVTIRGCEDEELYYEVSGKCLQEILFLFFSPNESQADVLFSLLTDGVDHWMFDRVMAQLDCMKDKKILAKCLLKAFPRLVIEAKKWAIEFLFSVNRRSNLFSEILKSDDLTGKQSVVDFIDNLCTESPEQYNFIDEAALKSYLEDLKDFKNLAKEIEESMK